MRSVKFKRILDAIRKNSENDETIQKFLIEMVFEETENPGWWKDIYRKNIKKYALKESGKNED